jgi:hypothetical protein
LPIGVSLPETFDDASREIAKLKSAKLARHDKPARSVRTVPTKGATPNKSPRRLATPSRRRDRAAVAIRFECPACGGPHPLNAHGEGAAETA